MENYYFITNVIDIIILIIRSLSVNTIMNMHRSTLIPTNSAKVSAVVKVKNIE